MSNEFVTEQLAHDHQIPIVTNIETELGYKKAIRDLADELPYTRREGYPVSLGYLDYGSTVMHHSLVRYNGVDGTEHLVLEDIHGKTWNLHEAAMGLGEYGPVVSTLNTLGKVAGIHLENVKQVRLGELRSTSERRTSTHIASTVVDLAVKPEVTLPGELFEGFQWLTLDEYKAAKDDIYFATELLEDFEEDIMQNRFEDSYGNRGLEVTYSNPVDTEGPKKSPIVYVEIKSASSGNILARIEFIYEDGMLRIFPGELTTKDLSDAESVYPNGNYAKRVYESKANGEKGVWLGMPLEGASEEHWVYKHWKDAVNLRKGVSLEKIIDICSRVNKEVGGRFPVVEEDWDARYKVDLDDDEERREVELLRQLQDLKNKEDKAAIIDQLHTDFGHSKENLMNAKYDLFWQHYAGTLNDSDASHSEVVDMLVNFGNSDYYKSQTYAKLRNYGTDHDQLKELFELLEQFNDKLSDVSGLYIKIMQACGSHKKTLDVIGIKATNRRILSPDSWYRKSVVETGLLTHEQFVDSCAAVRLLDISEYDFFYAVGSGGFEEGEDTTVKQAIEFCLEIKQRGNTHGTFTGFEYEDLRKESNGAVSHEDIMSHYINIEGRDTALNYWKILNAGIKKEQVDALLEVELVDSIFEYIDVMLKYDGVEITIEQVVALAEERPETVKNSRSKREEARERAVKREAKKEAKRLEEWRKGKSRVTLKNTDVELLQRIKNGELCVSESTWDEY